MVKVVHFAHWTRSGITSLIRDIGEDLDHGFVLLLSDAAFKEYYSKLNPKIELNCRLWTVPLSFLKFFRFLRANKVQLVHCHSFTPLLVTCFLFWRGKIILHVHNEYPYLKDYNLKSIFKRCLLRVCLFVRSVTVIAVSRDSKECIENAAKVPAHLVLNGVKDCGTLRPPFTEVEDQFRFYSVCRLEQQKNLKSAIDLVAQLNEKSLAKKVTYHIYGDGPDRSALERYVFDRDLTDYVTFHGFHSDPEVLCEWYDYYLCTSSFEGLSLSMLSAMRGKNIVFTTPVGELGKVLYSSDAGHLIEGDIEKRASKVEAVMNSSAESKRKTQEEARGLYLKAYSYDIMIKKMKLIYDGLS